MSTKLILADQSEIALLGGATMRSMSAHYGDRAAMLKDWEKITPANLKRVQVDTDGVVTGKYDDLILEAETSMVAEDGSVITVWGIREKTREEKLEERITQLEEGQAVLDGAIADLGEATSIMAEQIGGVK